MKEPEPYLPTLLEDLDRYVFYPYEVLVQTEKGLGYAVKCGIEKAKGDLILVCDADGSHGPQYINALLNRLEKWNCSIVIGSRYVKGGKTQDTLARKLISRIFCEFAKELFNLNIKDNMSGFIVAKKEVFDKYPIRNNGFKFVLDLLVRSRRTYVAREYPIVFEKRQMGKSKANSKEALHTLIFMLKLKSKLK